MMMPGVRNLIGISFMLVYLLLIHTTNADELNACENTDFTIRWGQGGFRDSRAEDDKLGGGQFALDLSRCGSPIGITLSSEYYTKGPVWDAQYNYEISSMYSLNLNYTDSLSGFEKTDYFLFGGIGRLKVPDQQSHLLNLGAGLHWKRFQHVGFYALINFLYAQKNVDSRAVIDFNETIMLLGISYRFSL